MSLRAERVRQFIMTFWVSRGSEACASYVCIPSGYRLTMNELCAWMKLPGSLTGYIGLPSDD